MNDYKVSLKSACLTAIFLGLYLMVLNPSFSVEGDKLKRLERLAASQYGQESSYLAGELSRLILNLEHLDTRSKLEGVNTFFNNNIRFSSDQEIWGQEDYWASPLETIGKRAGDCEDFTIAKFAILRALDVPVEKLRLTYVRAKIGGAYSNKSQAHMVLSYYESPGAVPLILDNMLHDIRPANRRPDLAPVFGFNSDRLWVGSATAATAYDPKSRISKWQSTLLKLKNEGLN